jgi:hypothetical protein
VGGILANIFLQRLGYLMAKAAASLFYNKKPFTPAFAIDGWGEPSNRPAGC